MSWLERLKGHVADAGGIAANCQNRQYPGSVSFDGASVARIPSNQSATVDPLADFAGLSPVQEAARRDVLAQLGTNPTVKRAFVNRFENGALIVTLAVRGIGTCELSIPAERFNPDSPGDCAALLACIRAGGGNA
jgi:hypothetical protein